MSEYAVMCELGCYGRFDTEEKAQARVKELSTKTHESPVRPYSARLTWRIEVKQ